MQIGPAVYTSGVPRSGPWSYGQSGSLVTGIESGYSADGPPFIGRRWVPPASLVGPLFVPVHEGGTVGLLKPYFFEHFTTQPVACRRSG